MIQWTNASVVTPSDVANLTAPSRGLYVGGAGNISVVTAGGQTTLFTAVPVGTIIPLSVVRVNATNTTATLIVAIW